MGWIDVGGARLAVDEHGEGPPLVLVHGSGADASTWDPVVDELAAHHRVLAYDRRGYRRSRHAPVRDHRVHSRDLVAVLEHVGAPAHVIGWSSGGNVALGAAVEHPGLFATLVVVEAPYRGLRGVTGSMLAVLGRAKALQARGRPREAAAAFLRWAFGTRDGGNGFDRLPREDREQLLDSSANVLAELDPHPFGVLGDHIALDDVAAVPTPMTWVVGGASRPWYGVLAEPVLRRRPATRGVVVPGASHLVHVEQPAAFTEVVLRTTGARG